DACARLGLLQRTSEALHRLYSPSPTRTEALARSLQRLHRSSAQFAKSPQKCGRDVDVGTLQSKLLVDVGPIGDNRRVAQYRSCCAADNGTTAQVRARIHDTARA
ncbi:hypothetical protein ABQE58_25010, partial [Mycolicibacterium elephantis]